MKAQTIQKPEMKKFLSMELAERLIRVEQAVSASFNKYVSFDQTSYYKGMSQKEKEAFSQYLKNKKKKKAMLSSFIFVSMFVLSLFTSSMTGNFIAPEQMSLANLFPVIAFLVVVGILGLYGIYSFISKRIKDNRFKKHSEIIHKFTISKRI